MITYTITGDAVTVSDTIREYVHNHYQTFEKFVDVGDTKEMQIVISKNTAHHREDTFKVEVSFKIKRGDFFITVDNAEVMSALD
jgi:ribosomal subunit interface protein